MMCKIKHNWEYYKDSVVYKSMVTIVGNSNRLDQNISTKTYDIRKCKRCNKKQINRTSLSKRFLDVIFLNKSSWKPCDLTNQEIRDFKLKNLGI
jgi:hypothetical protein